MNNQNLYLVGTAHLDLDGKKRLDTILDKLSPSIVALEFHKDRESMLKARKSRQKEAREINETIDEIGLNLTSKQRATVIESGYRINDVVGYEFKSSRDYTQRNHSSRLEYIDISIFENGKKEFTEGYNEAMKYSFKQIMEVPELKQLWFKTLDRGMDAYMESMRENIEQIYKDSEAMSELYEIIRDPETFESMTSVMPPQAVQALEQIFNPQRDEAMGARIRELYNGDSRLIAVVGLAHLTGLKTKIRDLKPKVMTLAEYDSV